MIPEGSARGNVRNSVAVVGLGAMGLPIATRLAKNGYEVYGCDLQEERRRALDASGGTAVQYPSQLPPECSAYLLLMPNPDVTNEVVFGERGLQDGLRADDVVVNLGTIGPDAVLKLAETLQPKGVQVLDAPMGKSSEAAAEGTLSLMVSGETSTYRSLQPLLELIATDITFCGELGIASTIKIVNNLVSATILEAVAEGMALGMKAGASPELMTEVLSNSGADSWHLRNTFAKRVAKRDFKAGFSVDLATKDMKIGVDMASKRQVPLPVIGSAYQRFIRAQSAQLGSEDWGALAKLSENDANLTLDQTNSYQ
jgi:3-hydroxyisobutyrate dehydrogenase-like beta-hydroxyacid dehydrogenase